LVKVLMEEEEVVGCKEERMGDRQGSKEARKWLRTREGM
jgi:hypothetical protein